MARRFMWTVIQDLADAHKDVVVILTTHSMEECEALCNRINSIALKKKNFSRLRGPRGAARPGAGRPGTGKPTIR